MHTCRRLATLATGLVVLLALPVALAGPVHAAGAPQGKVVALGEEALLADLLDLGVPVAASTANVADEGFQGIVDDTDGIEIFTSTELKLEEIAALEPDHIVITDFWLEYIPKNTLEGLADKVTVVDTSGDWRADYLRVAKAFGKTKLAKKHLAAYDRKAAAAGKNLGAADRTVSLTAIYPGGNVAIWVDGGTLSSDVLDDLGFDLVPNDAGAEPDSQGRVYVSTERLDLLEGDDLVLLYSPQIDGEEAAVADMKASGLWKSIPAVAAGKVVEIDRLGYNGIAGRSALVDEFEKQLAT